MSAAKSFDYVVLGAGNAGGYLAKAFAEKGISSVALITDEAVAPYERPALSKGFLMGKANLPGFHTSVGGGGVRQDPEWYAANGMTLITGAPVVKADASTKTVTTKDGSVITANNALILATGSDTIRLTRSPGHELEGIHYLRNHADGLALRDAMQTAKKCVIVGGGYIGMECAAAMATSNIPTTMVFPEPHLMERLFTPEMAAPYTKHYNAANVDIVQGMCEAFVGSDGRVSGVKLRDGPTVEGDLVVVGVGARPNTQLLEGQVAMADRPVGGVQVDGHFRSSVAGVYAIGDVCAFPLAKYGREQRVEHVTHARASAAHLVAHLAGAGEDVGPYDYLPHFYSRVFNLSWKFWGDCQGDAVTVGSMDPKMVTVWVNGGKVMGAFLEGGSDEENDVIKQVAIQQPAVDAAAFAKAGSVEAALALLK